jgi:hypothetical protein
MVPPSPELTKLRDKEEIADRQKCSDDQGSNNVIAEGAEGAEGPSSELLT